MVFIIPILIFSPLLKSKSIKEKIESNKIKIEDNLGYLYDESSDEIDHYNPEDDNSDNSDNDDDSRYIDSRMNQMLKTMPKQILKTLKLNLDNMDMVKRIFQM